MSSKHLYFVSVNPDVLFSSGKMLKVSFRRSNGGRNAHWQNNGCSGYHD